MAEKEKKDLTGLEIAAENTAKAKGTTQKDVEYDLTTALLKAAEFRTSEDAITEIDIRRNGVYFFTLHVHPISDTEARKCRKRATKMMDNPNNRKLPKIEKEFDQALFNSLIIYTATTEEDKKNVWGNKAVMDKHDILDPIDTIDLLLAVGEKVEIVDTILDISGMDSQDETTPEDYAKN